MRWPLQWPIAGIKVADNFHEQAAHVAAVQARKKCKAIAELLPFLGFVCNRMLRNVINPTSNS
jgi:hypothetical protein